MCNRKVAETPQTSSDSLQQRLLLLPHLAVGMTQLEGSFPRSTVLHFGKLFQGITVLSALGATSLSAANTATIYPFRRDN